MNKFILAFAILLTLMFAINAQTPFFLKDEQPKVVKAVAPLEYPPSANAINAKGEVLVEVKIDSLGEVVSAKAVSGHPLLRTDCVKAAKRWIFNSIEGKSRERDVQLTFSFEKSENKENASVSFKPPFTIELVSDVVVIVER